MKTNEKNVNILTSLKTMCKHMLCQIKLELVQFWEVCVFFGKFHIFVNKIICGHAIHEDVLIPLTHILNFEKNP